MKNLFLPFIILCTVNSIQAEQITILDEHFVHTNEGNNDKKMGFCIFKPYVDMPSNLVEPIDYAHGAAYFRLRIKNKPTTAKAQYNFGFQQGDHSLGEHFSDRIDITTAKTYQWSQPLDEWWKPDNHHVDFTQPVNRLMVVLWDDQEQQIDDRWNYGDWLTPGIIASYFPMEVQVQIVLVSKGGTFEGYPEMKERFPRFEVHTIDHQGNKMGQTSIIDVDNDGDLDWITGQAHHAGHKIWWWEYQNPDKWVQHYMGMGNSDVGGDVYDLNGDGWIDMLSGSKILLNTGKPKDEPFEVHDIGAVNSHDSEFADINGDGKMDAIANSDKAGLFWYEIPDDPTHQWKSHTIATIKQHKIHGGVSPNAVGDIDGDGDNDVVTGQAWYENIDSNGLKWKAHMNIDFGEHHKYGIAVRTWILDMDSDGDNDFVQTEADNPDGRVAWFQNDGSGDWTRHIIKDKGDGQDFHSLVVADFDNDGDMDIFTGGGPLSKSNKKNCYFWENTAGAGKCPTSQQWIEHFLTEKPCHEAVGADVDGDGDIDICTKSWSTGDEHLYFRNMLMENK